MLFGIKKKWSKCVSNLLKGLRLKSRQSLRRDVFYHDFSGCCHTVPVNKDQFFLFSRSRVLLFQNLQFYTSPSISRKKIKK